MNMITSTLLAAGFSLLAGSAAAQTCVANNCAALGFTKSAGNCEGDIIRCPFDTSKVFCKEKIACSLPVCKDKVTSKPENSSFVTTSCADCSGTHTINTGWRCNTGYESNGSSCVLPTPSCSVAGYYNGTSCSTFREYIFRECGFKYQELGATCSSQGLLGSGTCDVQSWRECCEQCTGGL